MAILPSYISDFLKYFLYPLDLFLSKETGKPLYVLIMLSNRNTLSIYV
jgi:hypothetical protein